MRNRSIPVIQIRSIHKQKVTQPGNDTKTPSPKASSLRSRLASLTTKRKIPVHIAEDTQHAADLSAYMVDPKYLKKDTVNEAGPVTDKRSIPVSYVSNPVKPVQYSQYVRDDSQTKRPLLSTVGVALAGWWATMQNDVSTARAGIASGSASALEIVRDWWSETKATVSSQIGEENSERVRRTLRTAVPALAVLGLFTVGFMSGIFNGDDEIHTEPITTQNRNTSDENAVAPANEPSDENTGEETATTNQTGVPSAVEPEATRDASSGNISTNTNDSGTSSTPTGGRGSGEDPTATTPSTGTTTPSDTTGDTSGGETGGSTGSGGDTGILPPLDDITDPIISPLQDTAEETVSEPILPQVQEVTEPVVSEPVL